MGVSSYITADTGRSIPVAGLAPCPTFPVYMVGPPKEGGKREFLEEAYGGYLRFGGKLVPEFAAELNGVPEEGIGSMIREDVGWVILHDGNHVEELDFGEFRMKLPLVYPQFIEDLEARDTLDFHKPPKRCPDQGWFLTPDGKGGGA